MLPQSKIVGARRLVGRQDWYGGGGALNNKRCESWFLKLTRFYALYIYCCLGIVSRLVKTEVERWDIFERTFEFELYQQFTRFPVVITIVAIVASIQHQLPLPFSAMWTTMHRSLLSSADCWDHQNFVSAAKFSTQQREMNVETRAYGMKATNLVYGRSFNIQNRYVVAFRFFEDIDVLSRNQNINTSFRITTTTID